jgi:peptidoglycan/LPS O-acetylase OafA/YrhL
MQTLDTPTRQFIEMDSSGRGIPHMPGLDGLRGLAVAGVIAFHSPLAVAEGGFLGVSTFFTLSGFLITSLLLSELRSDGSVDLRSFWARRLRRLLPAANVTLALTVLFGLTVATASQRLELRGDVLGGLLQVANWRFLLGGTSYGDLFAAPSPVLHFWSLAIEEQFYWVFPPLLLGVVRLVRGRRRSILGVLLALCALSWSLPFLVDLSTDRVYFGTDTRAVELLLGAALAVLFSHPPVRRRIALRYHWRSAVLLVGTACLAVQLYWWTGVEQSSEWLYRGGLGLYGLMSCAVIAAVALPTGPLRTGLSAPPLRYLGQRSYGLYLLHWPVFLCLRQRFDELPAWSQAVVGVAVSLVLAELSYRFVEQPIRRGRWPARGRGHRVALASVVAVALLATVPMPVAEEDVPLDFEEAAEELRSRSEQPQTTTTIARAPGEAPVPRVGTFGDSLALMMGMGLTLYTQQPGAVLADGPYSVELGCPVSRFESIRVDFIVEITERCTNWPTRWVEQLQAPHEIVQLITGAWEIPDAQLPGDSEHRSIEDPAVESFIESEMLAAVDTLSSRGALVLLVLYPPDDQTIPAAESERLLMPESRTRRFHDVLRRVAEQRPEVARVVDLAGWFGARSQDRSWRSDGVHLSAEKSAEIYQLWMADEVDRIWQEWWKERQAGGG